MFNQENFEKLLEADSPLKVFSFFYNGEPCDLSRAASCVKQENDKTCLIYEAVPGVIRVTLELIRRHDFPVIEYTPYFENISDSDSGILSEISVLDFESDYTDYFGRQKLKQYEVFGNSRLRIRYHLGSRANGSDFLPQYRDIFSRAGCNKLELVSQEAKCSTDYLPFFGVDHDTMNGVNLAIGWNCSWKFSVEKDIDDVWMGAGKKSRIRCGMRHAAFKLHPGEKVMQPGIILHFREGKSIRDGQNEFRRFMIAHHSPRDSKGKLIKPPICIATWGGLETEKQLQRIQTVGEHRLPYENLWIDAGWMGSPGPCPHFLEESDINSDWPARVGSWNFNSYAHPDGFRPVSEAVHKNGMRLLVWFEVLRIFSKSEAPVITEHPEWLLGDKEAAAAGKGVNFLLNIGIPEARKYLVDTVISFMEKEGIDDYREDFNLVGIDPYFEMGDEPDRIGITEMKFAEGVYLYWEELRRHFPDMIIDNCCSGGRRLDYKTATLAFPLCQSDFACYQPYEVECIQLENFYLDEWMPLHGTLNWGMEDLYHLFSGLGGGLGDKIWQFNGREPRADHDYDLHRKALEWGKLLRDMHVSGDVYPLTENPEEDWTKWSGQQVHNPEGDYGTVQIYRRQKSPDADFRLALSGIKTGIYQVEYFTGETLEITGAELKNLVVSLAQPRSFQVIYYKLKEEKK
ncbi:MAG: alpha-galactosidase [Lentisphaeria bacterium]|nr:alpha-galactosidase [Lentisphaeria bacterium]